MKTTNQKIEAMIYNIRGQRVMLDSDLARLYGVEVRALNQAVKRNQERFPDDFVLIPTSNELTDLRSQIVILGELSAENQVFRFTPTLFTENGVAMLSSVLKSPQAIQVNIAIMRTFTKLRSFLAMENSHDSRLQKLEATARDTQHLFKIVFEKLDQIETPALPKYEHPLERKRIGLKPKKANPNS